MKMTGRWSEGTRSLACQRSSKFDGMRRPRMPTSLSMAPVQPGARALGAGVGVAGEDLVADEVLDEGQATARGGVVRVRDAARAVGAVHHLVVTDDARAERGQQVVLRSS